MGHGTILLELRHTPVALGVDGEVVLVHRDAEKPCCYEKHAEKDGNRENETGMQVRTSLAPVRAPRVANDPVLLAVFDAPAHDADLGVGCGRTGKPHG